MLVLFAQIATFSKPVPAVVRVEPTGPNPTFATYLLNVGLAVLVLNSFDPNQRMGAKGTWRSFMTGGHSQWSICLEAFQCQHYTTI